MKLDQIDREFRAIKRKQRELTQQLRCEGCKDPKCMIDYMCRQDEQLQNEEIARGEK